MFLFVAVGFFLPATPRAKTSLLFAKINKDSLLKNTPSPRIIFIGGSNLSFGLNSQTIKDSLGINPINTGIHASIGLIYMLDNSLQYIKRGDIVVVVPEYSNYYGDAAYGREELLRTAYEVDGFNGLSSLKMKQLYNIVPLIPKYIFSKFSLKDYRNFKLDPIYSKNSFNKYGDAYSHWLMPGTKVKPFKKLSNGFNIDVIIKLLDYQKKIEEKGAQLFLSYPGYQATSFDVSKDEILFVEKTLRSNDFKLLGTPQRYRMPDILMFDTPYHLSKKGVDIRTELLIQDLKTVLK